MESVEANKHHILSFNMFYNTFIYFFSLFLIAVSLWTQKYFGIVSIDQVNSTIHFGIDGVLAADSIYMQRFIKWCLIWPAIVTIFLLFTKRFLSKLIQKSSAKTPSVTMKAIKLLDQMSNKYIFLLLSLFFVLHQFSLYDYLKNSYLSNKFDYFALNYTDPKLTALQTKHLKNVVIIYVESLEATYSDKKVFGHDLLQSLNKLQKDDAASFSYYRQMPGTGWTIAGIVGTQCGVPLKQLTIFNGNRIGENVNHFLSNATCLSDILTKYGYKNIFMNGSSTKVGGKLKFFTDHHYAEIYGKEEWLKEGINESKMNGWGLPDHDLFERAKIILEKNIKSHKPFNLTILTVDTHGYAGQLSEYCKKQGFHDFAGIVECSSNEVADFVQYVKAKHGLDKVNIVILGDHLVMTNPILDKLNSSSLRSVFNLFISKDPIHKNTDEIMTFSLLPTILEFIGFDFKDGKLGLGYSGINQYPSKQSSDYINDIEKNITNFSEAYSQLWQNKHLGNSDISGQLA